MNYNNELHQLANKIIEYYANKIPRAKLKFILGRDDDGRIIITNKKFRANYGPLFDYKKKDVHLTIIGLRSADWSLEAWGGGDGYFHYGEKFEYRYPFPYSGKRLSARKLLGKEQMQRVLAAGEELIEDVLRS